MQDEFKVDMLPLYLKANIYEHKWAILQIPFMPSNEQNLIQNLYRGCQMKSFSLRNFNLNWKIVLPWKKPFRFLHPRPIYEVKKSKIEVSWPRSANEWTWHNGVKTQTANESINSVQIPERL